MKATQLLQGTLASASSVHLSDLLYEVASLSEQMSTGSQHEYLLTEVRALALPVDRKNLHLAVLELALKYGTSNRSEVLALKYDTSNRSEVQ